VQRERHQRHLTELMRELKSVDEILQSSKEEIRELVPEAKKEQAEAQPSDWRGKMIPRSKF
jgi:hypothetical protein